MTDIPVPETFEGIVEQFVKLRDRIKEADAAHKEKTAPAKKHLELLGNLMLKRLNDIGGESVKSKSGTVYRTDRKTASIADGDIFRKYVIENANFDIVDWRANAPAVEDFIKEHGSPPPGVNYNVQHTVGVRRA